jgi:hypothetical protein
MRPQLDSLKYVTEVGIRCQILHEALVILALASRASNNGLCLFDVLLEHQLYTLIYDVMNTCIFAKEEWFNVINL